MMKSRLVLAWLLVMPALTAAQEMNGATVQPRVINEDTNSDFSFINDYPTRVNLTDRVVDGDGTAPDLMNRHSWRFSADGGATPFQFTNDTYFITFMDLSLTGSPVILGNGKVAGFLYSSTSGEEGQFTVDYSQGWIRAYGGPFPFYQFDTDLFKYDMGETIRLGIRYAPPATPGGNRRIEYFANGRRSGLLEIANAQQGLGGGTFGGHLHITVGTPDASNFGSADFSNITYTPVPEPATVLALVAGGLFMRRRRARR